MWSDLKATVRTLTGTRPAGRGLTVLDDDVFLVSYPKSGNTWLRFLVGNLVNSDDPVTFANVEDRVPDIYHHSDRDLKGRPRPRFIKSHEYFDPRYRKLVYVVRDPRDVVTSYYHHHIKFGRIPEGYPIARYVERFLGGTLDVYGSWFDHVGSWVGARTGSPGFLVIRYEDLHRDPAGTLKDVAAHIGVAADGARIEHVIELSSADRMRRLEKAQANDWKPTRNSRKDLSFVRKANAGNWSEELPKDLAEAIVGAWGPLMAKYRYLVAPAA